MRRSLVPIAWSLLALGAAPPQSQSGNQKPPADAPPPAVVTAVKTPALMPPDATYRPPVGQTLVYAAEWRVFPAGVVTLRMEQAGKDITKVYQVGKSYRFAVRDLRTGEWLESGPMDTEQEAYEKRMQAYKRRLDELTGQAG